VNLRSRIRSGRLSVVLVAALLLAAPPGGAQEALAELTVTAFGAQRFDLATGRTVLEDGGEVVDRTSGVRLTAGWIAYVEGATLEARDATLDGDLGQVEAERVWIDLVAGRLEATGGVTLARDGLRASAARLALDGPAGLAWLAGTVVAEVPEAAAEEVWIDVADGRLVLVGPYRYQDAVFLLEGGEGARLQLDPVPATAGGGFDARSAVAADLIERIAATRGDDAAE
jgi:hypothetical protein